MEAEARYQVDPGARSIGVTVEVSFTNTAPDPPGRFSLFEEVDLAIHDGASELEASDSSGALTVAAEERDGVNVASVSLREGLRRGQSATFTLEYVLEDGATDQLRVRPSLVVFSAWSFGTDASVRIELPAGYEVSADGDELTASQEGSTIVLASGEISDSRQWLAVVTAARPGDYETLRQSVPLAGGTVDLQVRAWPDDLEWGERVLDRIVAALPLLEEAAGFPYPGVGPLIVVEAATAADGEIGEGSVNGQQIEVGYAAGDFTLLHEIAHVWISPGLFADRWIREGLASQLAAAVAGPLEVEPPYDPAERREQLADDAFPLLEWGAGEASTQRDAFAYAASWALFELLARRIGPEALQVAVQRVASGIGAYDPASAGGAVSRPGDAPAIDTRRFLDQLEEASGVDLSELFTEHVFGEAGEPLLAERSEARSAYAQLQRAAGDWGTPEPVRTAMESWSFDRATAEIAAASTWLEARDELLADIAEAGLSTPSRLRQRYVESGGDSASWRELEAEAAVVEAYRRVAASSAADRGPLVRLGLVGETEPDALLTVAAGHFADGDLAEAESTIRQAELILSGAEAAGLARLIGLLAVLVAAAAGVVLLVRRPRRGRRPPAVSESAPGSS